MSRVQVHNSPWHLPVDILIELHGAVQLGELFLQQLQVRIHVAQLQGDGLLQLSVRRRPATRSRVSISGRASRYQQSRIPHTRRSFKHLLEEILGARPQPQLLVDLLIELASLVLQLSSAGRYPRIRALRIMKRIVSDASDASCTARNHIIREDRHDDKDQSRSPR